MKRRGLVKFEVPVVRNDGSHGKIDVLWPGQMLVEQKSAHKDMDRAVDRAYRPQPFATEAQRLEFLFGLYQEYTAGMFKEEKKKRKRGRKKKV